MQKDKTVTSTSLLSRNMKIEGDIRGEENLHVDGHVKGSIKLSGNLLVGASGVVEADVEAFAVIIQGTITGNVVARQQLEIQPAGQLIGDCAARSIDIKEGAVFEGRSNMIKSGTVSKAAATAAAAVPQSSGKSTPA